MENEPLENWANRALENFVGAQCHPGKSPENNKLIRAQFAQNRIDHESNFWPTKYDSLNKMYDLILSSYDF